MIVERSMSDGWLSNTYVVADELGGSAVMVDAGGPVQPLFDFLKRGQLTL
jgi:hydroxyacylglutathione hydrolase